MEVAQWGLHQGGSIVGVPHLSLALSLSSPSSLTSSPSLPHSPLFLSLPPSLSLCSLPPSPSPTLCSSPSLYSLPSPSLCSLPLTHSDIPFRDATEMRLQVPVVETLSLCPSDLQTDHGTGTGSGPVLALALRRDVTEISVHQVHCQVEDIAAGVSAQHLKRRDESSDQDLLRVSQGEGELEVLRVNMCLSGRRRELEEGTYMLLQEL